MPAQFNSPRYRKFTGGLDTKHSQHNLTDDQLTVANNVIYSTAGSVQKRGAWKKLISAAVGTANNLIGVFQGAFVSAGAITRKEFATDGVKVFRRDSAVWTDITGALSRTALSTTIYTFVNFTNIVIALSNAGAPWKIADGASNATDLLGSPPSGEFGIVYNNHIFVVTPNSTRLHISDLGDAETWPAANFIDIPASFDGEPITGLAVLYGNLVVFKRNSIYTLTGTSIDDFSIQKLNATQGCVSYLSVTTVNNLIYYVSDNGLYAMNLFNTREVSYNIENRYINAIFNQLQGSGGLARNRIHATHYREIDSILMLVDSTATGQDQHDRILMHDYANAGESGDPVVSEWTTNDTINAPSLFAEYQAENGTIRPLASFYDKYVYIFTPSSFIDDTAASTVSIALEIGSKYFDFGDPFVTKSIRFIYTSGLFSGGSPDFRITKSDDIGISETAATYSPTGVFFNAKSTFPNASFGGPPQAKYFKFGFLSSDGGDFRLDEMGFDLVTKGRRGTLGA